MIAINEYFYFSFQKANNMQALDQFISKLKVFPFAGTENWRKTYALWQESLSRFWWYSLTL